MNSVPCFLFVVTVVVLQLCCVAEPLSSASSNNGHVRVADGVDDHRRGHEADLLQQLEVHVRTSADDKELKRAALRRKIHEEHIQAHLNADPDISVEPSEDVRRKLQDSRRKLLGKAPLSGFRALLLGLVFCLPIAIFVVWMRT